MLFRITGVEICVVVFIPVMIAFWYSEKRRRTLNGYRIGAFVLKYLACALIVVYTIFPFAFQWGAPIHSHIYLNPLGRIQFLILQYRSRVHPFAHVAVHTVLYWAAAFVVYGFFGFVLRMNLRKKHSYFTVLILSFAVEVWYAVWGLAIGGIYHYKTISTEDVILFNLFGFAGIKIQEALARTAEKYQEKSNILKGFNRLFRTAKSLPVEKSI